MDLRIYRYNIFVMVLKYFKYFIKVVVMLKELMFFNIMFVYFCIFL